MEIQTKLIKDNAEEINDFISDLETEYNKITTSINDLKKGWDGNRANEFYKELEQNYLPNLKKSIGKLKDYYDFLSSVPKAYEKLDESYKNKKIEV